MKDVEKREVAEGYGTKVEKMYSAKREAVRLESLATSFRNNITKGLEIEDIAICPYAHYEYIVIAFWPKDSTAGSAMELQIDKEGVVAILSIGRYTRELTDRMVKEVELWLGEDNE